MIIYLYIFFLYFRIDDFLEGISILLFIFEENEGYFKDRVLLVDEIIWVGSSEGKY